MEAPNLSLLLLLLSFISLLQTSIVATTKKSYIVYLGSHSSYGLNPSSFDPLLITESHYDILGSLLGSKDMAKEAIFYSYTRNINGFAAVLDQKQAEDLAKHPNVISVFENKERKLHTTRSWNFLGVEKDEGLSNSAGSIWNAAKFGQDTIIANIDTGVWPEAKSFSDDGYGPVPSRWRGTCQTDVNFHCNRKLIGGRYFYKGYIAGGGALNASLLTVRDNDGHGTHTLSTAGGDFVSGANVFGNGNGTAKGGAPKARVAAYKVCWPSLFFGGCFDADILAAFEFAISDGVDVISVSLGGTTQEFLTDPLAIASFHAVQHGIVVVCSAGNDGPSPGSVTNVAPWEITVGASSMDRDFASYVILGNRKRFKGTSLSATALPPNKFFPLIKAVDAKASNVSDYSAQFCGDQSLDPNKVKGKIVVCLQGETEGVDKGHEAARAGAVGMILANDQQTGGQIFPEPHFLPASDINYNDGTSVYQYINSTKAPVAYITNVRTMLGVKPAPVMAAFSSRGPSSIEESILKPDITAPGVNIIAAFSASVAPSISTYDKRQVAFNLLSGTSMSCPHVSGIAALLKTLYPKWSPAAIKSAIMTTAKTRGNGLRSILDSTMLKATPLAYGAGHVHPNSAADPGLVYDITVDDYLNFLCARGYNETQLKRFSNEPFTCAKSFKLTDFNYPSISVPNLQLGPVTINRKVKNVGSPGTYVARVKAPRGFSVSVEPSTLQFTGVDEEKSFKVVLRKTGRGRRRGYAFGTLVWSDAKHFVRSPIAVNFGQ